MVPFAYLSLLIFLLAFLIPACNSSSPAFCMMYSAYKLNEQGDDIQPCHTSFPFWNESVVLLSGSNYSFLTHIQISQETGKVVWYAYLFKNFPLFVVIHTGKVVSIVNEAEVNVFLKFSFFLYDPTNAGNLISGSSVFSKPSLHIWKFLVQILLKPSLKDFEHNLTSM